MQKNKKDDLRMPPQSIVSEKAVLGSIMLRKDALLDIEDILFPDSFYSPKHKMIFLTKQQHREIRRRVEIATIISITILIF